MTVRFLFRLAIFLAMLPALAAVAEDRPAPDGELDTALELLDRMDRLTLRAEYAELPLDDVAADLRSQMDIPLNVDWEALRRLGVRKDTSISLRMPSASASTVLSVLAMLLGNEFERPVMEMHGGSAVLTTIAATRGMRLTAIYDVRDLLSNDGLVQRLRDEAPVIEVEPESDASMAKGESDGEAEAAAPPEAVDPTPDGQSSPQAPIRTLPFLEGVVDPGAEPLILTPGEELIMLLTDHIDPEAWIDFGGDRAKVSDNDGILLISAAPTTHRKLRDALRRLRMADPRSVRVHATLVDIPKAEVQRHARTHLEGSAALASALVHDPSATVLWESNSGVAIGSALRIESLAANGAAVRLAINPSFDVEAGLLRIAVDAASRQGEDQRSVGTEIVLRPDESGTVIELPAGKTTELTRLLVLVVSRV